MSVESFSQENKEDKIEKLDRQIEGQNKLIDRTTESLNFLNSIENQQTAEKLSANLKEEKGELIEKQKKAGFEEWKNYEIKLQDIDRKLDDLRGLSIEELGEEAEKKFKNKIMEKRTVRVKEIDEANSRLASLIREREGAWKNKLA
jgi:hypothetical protein